MFEFKRLVVFDCDSTLSAVEGIDELALIRGEETFKACEQMTLDAMEGLIPLESVFAKRLDLIKPTRNEVERLGLRYIETVEPTAKVALLELKKMGWTPAILSGGFTQAIQPLADYLEVELVEAVSLNFNEQGDYLSFDLTAPTARSGGKPAALAKWRKDFSCKRIVMVGDGSSDLETQGTADLFVGFGRYVRRTKVELTAEAFILSLSDLPHLLQKA